MPDLDPAVAGGQGLGSDGYIDRSGAWAITPRFAAAGSFSEGLAPVMMPPGGSSPGFWGYVNHKGEMVIGPRFAGADSFTPGGLAWVLLLETTMPEPFTRDTSLAALLSSQAPAPAGIQSPGTPAYIDKAGRIVWQSRPSGGAGTGQPATTSPTPTTNPGAATSSTPPSSDAPPEVIYGTSPSGGTPPSIKIDENPTVITVGS